MFTFSPPFVCECPSITIMPYFQLPLIKAYPFRIHGFPIIFLQRLSQFVAMAQLSVSCIAPGHCKDIRKDKPYILYAYPPVCVSSKSKLFLQDSALLPTSLHYSFDSKSNPSNHALPHSTTSFGIERFLLMVSPFISALMCLIAFLEGLMRGYFLSVLGFLTSLVVKPRKSNLSVLASATFVFSSLRLSPKSPKTVFTTPNTLSIGEG